MIQVWRPQGRKKNPPNGTYGVYKIEFPNGEYYIGSSLSCTQRCAIHRRNFRKGKNYRGLQKCYDQQGYPKFEVLFTCDNEQEAIACENQLIDLSSPMCLNKRRAIPTNKNQPKKGQKCTKGKVHPVITQE